MTGAHPLPPRAPGRLGGVALVLGGALSVQFGSALAALLFPRTGVAGAVTLRLTIGALLMLVVCRPRVRGYGRRDWAAVLAFGLALAGMNSIFYQAIERIPLGPAVTLEVLGPLALSVIAARRPGAWCCAALALAGVVLLGQGGFDRLDPAGAALALTAGAMWAAYIVCSARIGARFPGADGLALALTVAALLTLPFGLADGGGRLADPVVLGLGTGLALLASVLPYSLELAALRRLPTATFAVMMSLGPAIAAVAGWLVLGQALRPVEVLAIALVVAASAGAVRAAAPAPSPAPPAVPGPPGAEDPAAVSAAAAAPPARR
ncbi:MULTISPECIES: EamA family transporter [unclassified Micromonospora]|uniref:EamA family transporter n=1 Tax=unclassified Micromonospora TaxID=2617518 RepID=UPI001C22386B|nr:MULTISPECIES: EamA family transporter [unclassified Micromonospora]MBU8860753.1 EamA family transporter [Micromonospora sp. WMMB482]MDM4780293.1 EamA family transporter [Micromonospora sp. b486]